MPWTIKVDPSGRAACSGFCRTKIAKGSLRMQNVGSRHAAQTQYCEACMVRCMTRVKLQNSMRAFGGDFDSVPGYTLLKKVNPDVYMDLLALAEDGNKQQPRQPLGAVHAQPGIDVD